MPPERRVRIITDSTADLPPDLIARWGIRVVPLQVRFGEESFRDGLDLPADAFYERLARGEVPTTSQPSVGAFRRAYEQAAGAGGEVVSIHLSAELSGTCQTALLAAEQVDGQVVVIDSGYLSMALGWLVVLAAEAARERRSLQEIVDLVQEAKQRVRIPAYVEDFEHLRRGGRIGHAQPVLGSPLDIRAILTLQEGETVLLERVRTRQAGLRRLVERVADMGPLGRVAVVYSGDPQGAEQVADGLSPIFPRDEMRILSAGQVVATHVGTAAVGVACLLLP